jgi:hypothetical protein
MLSLLSLLILFSLGYLNFNQIAALFTDFGADVFANTNDTANRVGGGLDEGFVFIGFIVQ